MIRMAPPKAENPILEYSPSSRAKCRICKKNIEKGTIRLGLPYVFRKNGEEIFSFRWHHLDCSLSKSPQSVVKALNHSTSLSAEERQKIRRELEDRGLIEGSSKPIKIGKLSPNLNRINLVAKVTYVFPLRNDLLITFRKIRPVYLKDDTGEIKLILNEDLSRRADLSPGDTLEITNVKVLNPYDNVVELFADDKTVIKPI